MENKLITYKQFVVDLVHAENKTQRKVYSQEILQNRSRETE